LTSGQAIVVAEPKSKASRSYTSLAERYLSTTARRAETLSAIADAATNGNGRRRRLLRKAS
jgi:MinD-like ATPase involved in chromosome partitioning or flagellar assembly